MKILILVLAMGFTCLSAPQAEANWFKKLAEKNQFGKSKARIRRDKQKRQKKVKKKAAPRKKYDPFAAETPVVKKKKKKKKKKSASAKVSVKGAAPLGAQLKGCDAPLFLRVNKNKQRMQIFENCRLTKTALVMTGRNGHRTKDFDGTINNQVIGVRSTDSARYATRAGKHCYFRGKPMGNMAYGLFYVKGLLAVHGTCAQWSLGNARARAKSGSHGCTRVHPEVAVLLRGIANDIGGHNVRLQIKDTFSNWSDPSK